MRFLVFEIGQEECAVPLEQVREVVGFPQFTGIPNSPSYVLGIMNLRDQVLPLLDLRIRLGVTPTLTHETSVVICSSEKNQFGIVVDNILSVVAPESNEILPVQTLSSSSDQVEIIQNVIRRPNGLALVFDMSKIVQAQDHQFFKLDQLSKDMKQAS